MFISPSIVILFWPMTLKNPWKYEGPWTYKLVHASTNKGLSLTMASRLIIATCSLRFSKHICVYEWDLEENSLKLLGCMQDKINIRIKSSQRRSTSIQNIF